MINGYGQSRLVTINGIPLDPAPSQKLRNHSPDGFAWGYPGSGPAQLALALLLHYSDANFALANYQQFKFDIIVPLRHGDDFSMPAKEVWKWLEAHGYERPAK